MSQLVEIFNQFLNKFGKKYERSKYEFFYLDSMTHMKDFAKNN